MPKNLRRIIFINLQKIKTKEITFAIDEDFIIINTCLVIKDLLINKSLEPTESSESHILIFYW